MNEIDGLESDEDDEQESKPQSKPVSKPVSNPKQNIPAANPTKKYKVEPEDDFGGGDDFAKLRKRIVSEGKKTKLILEAGLGAMKGKEIEDLERELAGLESDGDDGGDVGGADDDDDDIIPSVNKHSLPNITQEKKPSGGSAQSNSCGERLVINFNSEPAPVKVESKPQPNVGQVVGGMAQKAATGGGSSSSGVKPSGASFPLKHFTGNDAKKLIAIDNKFHGKDQIKTKALIDYEIKEVINPCLASSSVNAEVKAHLEAKKKSLETFKQVIFYIELTLRVIFVEF